MNRSRGIARKIILLLMATAVVGTIGYGLLPQPIEVDMATIQRHLIQVTVDQDGKTRIRERYVVSAPLAGRLLRVGMDPGDEVEAGKTLLATIEPRDPALLDDRAIAQAEARVKGAAAALLKMGPLLDEAQVAREYTENELQRVRDARRNNPLAISASEVDNKLLAFRQRSALLRSVRHAEEIARFELEQAKSALIRSLPTESQAGPQETEPTDPSVLSTTANNGPNNHNPDNPNFDNSGRSRHFLIRAPIDGRILRVFQESSAVVVAGTPLLELGDPVDLEVEIDVLSEDAVKIETGAEVLLEHWGGEHGLKGRVRLVEPAAFTKISTLGVEEQRVNVIVDLIDPPAARMSLGDGFRVEARIVIGQAPQALCVPTSALFRVGERWAVFRVNGQVASRQWVELGLQNGLNAEVLTGLTEGDLVVVHPGDDVEEGCVLRRRE
ncbi:MAG: HlyD family efflux transporter periplasmic adaptor subunit [Pirellulales bacterium]